MAQKINHYDVGDLWQPQATFTVGGVNTDPTNLTVRQQDAAGVETVLLNNVLVSTLTGASTPVAKTATGVFTLNPGITLTAAGYWFVKFEGTGAATASEQQQAIVDPDEFTADGGLSTRALVGLAEMKDWLQQQNIDTSSDLELVNIINDVSDRFHYEAGREFKVSGTNPQTRSFPIDPSGPRQAFYVDGDYRGDYSFYSPYARIVHVGDLTSYTQVQIIDRDWSTVLETVALTNITAYPTVRMPWEPIRKLEFQSTVTSLGLGMRLSVLGNFGFPSVPGNVKQAIKDAVAAIMDRDVEHYRQDLSVRPTGGEAGTGNTIVMSYGAQRILSLPAAAWAVAQSYRDISLG